MPKVTIVERLRRASVYEEYKAILSNLGDDAADEIERLSALNAECVGALESAAKTFEKYAGMHRAKGTVEGEQKAAANDASAKELRSVIATCF